MLEVEKLEPFRQGLALCFGGLYAEEGGTACDVVQPVF